MQQYSVLFPEALILVAALVVLFSEFFGGDRAAAVVGTAATAVAAVAVWVVTTPVSLFGTMLWFGDGVASAVMRSSIAGLCAIMLLWVVARGWSGSNAREAVSMVLFATAGGMLLVSANDMVVLLMTLELATMPLYVLIGYSRNDRRGLEGALKYFLLSLLTSLMMAYGLSFLFGLSGSTAYEPVLFEVGGIGLVAGLLVLVGFLAKTTAVPFQFWSPDAYGGSTVPAVAFVSSVGKIGPVYALIRFFAIVLPTVPGLPTLLLLASVASMMLGNFVAIVQPDVRRIVAYSGIANIGYMLLGVSAASVNGFASAAFFVVVYAVGVLGLLLVFAQEGPELQDVAGLVKRRPYAAWCSVAFLFSLIGFPPMVGFFGKLSVFSAAFHAGYIWAVVVAILMSVVSAGYAFNIIRAMFTPGEGAPEVVLRPSLEESTTYRQMPVLAASVIFVLMLLVLGLGLVAEPLVKLLTVGLL